MKLHAQVESGVEWITAELEPGEMTYDPRTDRVTFTVTFPGHVIGHEMQPREWMAMARAMVEGARAAREARVATL